MSKLMPPPSPQCPLSALLHKAITDNDIQAATAALDAGASPALQANEGGTPLMRAAICGNTDMCRLLVERGSDPKLYGKDGHSILMYAFSRASERNADQIIELVEFLIEAGAPVHSNVTGGLSVPPLMSAIALCLSSQKFVSEGIGARLCELLINRGACVNDKITGGGNSLHLVARLCRCSDGSPIFDPSLIPLFIKNGASVNSEDWRHRSPLRDAVNACNEEAVRQLLTFGADPCAKDKGGKTALFETPSVSIARLLLDAGVDPAITDKSGKTAEELLAKRSYYSKVHAFLKCVREQSELNKFTSTPPPQCLRARI
jgi:ankyrin repeat protein